MPDATIVQARLSQFRYRVLAFEGRPATLLARLFTPLGLLFLGTVKRQLETDLADLKREAERRARQGAGATTQDSGA